jgi:hypothetical protein
MLLIRSRFPPFRTSCEGCLWLLANLTERDLLADSEIRFSDCSERSSRPQVDFRGVVVEVLFMLVMVEVARLVILYLREHRARVAHPNHHPPNKAEGPCSLGRGFSLVEQNQIPTLTSQRTLR